MKCPVLFSILILCFLGTKTLAEDPVAPVIDAGEQRLEQNQEAQAKINTLHQTTLDIGEEYQSVLKVVDGLKTYNKILAKQISDQEDKIAVLNASVAEAAVIERQILPLLSRMLDSLDSFIALDLPFLLEERRIRVEKLQNLLTNAGLNNAEKARRVFEAFQIENDYGRTIETYKGTAEHNDQKLDVDFFRVGRVSLNYRSTGSEFYGYWDRGTKQWLPITSSRYKRYIDKGIKMAQQEMAPELLTIPLVTQEEARR